MDRKPKPAPFPVGTRLRCVDNKHNSFVIDNLTGSKALIYGPGLEVVIEEVKYGRQGTLRHLTDEDGPMYYDDTGEPVLDRTEDWCSVYYVVGNDGQRHGRLIHPEGKKNWEVVELAHAINDTGRLYSKLITGSEPQTQTQAPKKRGKP